MINVSIKNNHPLGLIVIDQLKMFFNLPQLLQNKYYDAHYKLHKFSQLMMHKVYWV